VKRSVGGKRGGRHRLKGRPARGLEWVVEQQPGRGRAQHRLPAPSLPAAGAIAAGVVLLATSAASSAMPTNAAGSAEPDRPQTEDHVAPRRVDNPLLPSEYQAAGIVENIDDPGATIPTVFTGDIPATVLDAYRHARDLINTAQPGCHLPLELLEAIGRVETGHARGGQVDKFGTTLTPILGPVLDGNGFAAIPDTDGGRFDGDHTWDRAVGPMQFIPGTWAGWFADGNGDQPGRCPLPVRGQPGPRHSRRARPSHLQLQPLDELPQPGAGLDEHLRPRHDRHPGRHSAGSARLQPGRAGHGDPRRPRERHRGSACGARRDHPSDTAGG